MSSPAFSPRDDGGLDDLDVAATLAAAGDAVAGRQAVEVRALAVDQHYAVLHADPPAPVRVPARTLADWEAGRDRLVQLGGDGTPLVRELPLAELAIARCTTLTAARNHLADALDLEFRLPGVWAELSSGAGQVLR